MRRALAVGLAVLLAGFLTRCNGCVVGGTDEDAGVDGGGPHPDGGDPALCTDGLSAIAIDPANADMTVGAAPSPIQFHAQGTFPTGTRDITDRVAWSASRLDDSPPGTIDPYGLYAPVAGLGGQITLTASAPCASGSTQLTLRLSTVQNDPGPGTTSRFDGTVVTAGAKVPVLVYPSDRTRFPRNIYKILFQWRTSGNVLFRLTFAGPYSTTVVYTDGAHPQCTSATPAAGCWEADQAAWAAIAGSNAGEAITLTLEAVSDGDANVYRAPPITLAFSRRDVRGAIFYWSTTAAGVRRATVSNSRPEAYVVAKPVATQLAPPGGTVKCVACHTVSRSGRKMVAYTETSVSKGLYVYDVTLDPPPIVRLTTEMYTARAFGTFSPDDSHIVATIGTPMAEFDTITGAKLATVVAKGTNPDWSPNANDVAFSDQAGDSPKLADLEVISKNPDGGWGPARVLVSADGGTNLFPRYTNDGEYIAYSRGKGGHGDVALQLWLVRADGTGRPIELVSANRVVNNAMTSGLYENNMPTWAPPGDLEWVAFNSLRPYGVVYPTGGTQQIWVAAVDRSIADGGDPSYPAFRFAFQDLVEDNHRAYWAEDVRVVTEDGGMCTAQNAACDPVADTCCLGTKCQPSSEITFACLPELPGGGGDGGTCIADGQPCDQVTGPGCCGASVCDVDGTGATVCMAPATCPGSGEACSPTLACCAGLFCVDGVQAACTTTTGCTCQIIFGKVDPGAP